MRQFRVGIGIVCLLALCKPAAAVRNHRIAPGYELSGGIGFAADLSRFAPGGFKWFNDFGVPIRGNTWFNLQLNVATGDNSGYCRREAGVLVCRTTGFGGTALELVAGAKIKWRMQRIPLMFFAKVGGAVDLIWFGDFAGAAIALRSGFGLRYFVVPSFGVGVSLLFTAGPALIRDNGVNFYGTIDMNFGIEWRF
ncbi:MAG: hypothetical protein H6707_11085 [Deltaproteobacteria bacterium]|nr:hypothetical protein [Deltaproteobacteria bacterium]